LRAKEVRKIFGRILQVLGWGCVGWFGVVGGGFSAILLMGFVGTGGREAGSELGVVLTGSVVGIVVGLVVAKLATRLARHEPGPKA
jgi:hypothetical protein